MEQVSEFIFMFMMSIGVITSTLLAASFANDSMFHKAVFHMVLAAFILAIMCMVKS